jgi:cytochrome c peroxidase
MVMADPDSTDQPVDELTTTAPAPHRWNTRRLLFVLGILAFGVVAAVAFKSFGGGTPAAAAPGPAHARHGHGGDDASDVNARMIKEGKQTFRFDTFGDEPFWSGTLQLDKAIEGAANGGEGPGVSPATALSVGLKVDSTALPDSVKAGIKDGTVDLNDPATTLALLKLNAVVGVKGTFNSAGKLSAVGIECALCHSTVDNSFAPGIGHRLDGWANRDLNVGAIISLSPNLQPVADLLHVDVPTVKKVLAAWGPGKFDAELFLDGKGFQPDGRSAAVLIPPAFGLAGVNLHTWTGWGSVPYWNAFVAVLEMHGQGDFTDARLDNAAQFPIAAENHFGHIKVQNDLVSPKLPALQAYQLSLKAPDPPKGSFDPKAAARGKALFNGKANCSSCHIAPTFTEPGENLHSGSEIGIDNFQADRSPTHMYRTSPLAGLWTHQKGGFYHDGRFPDLLSVVKHYNSTFNLNLTAAEENDLVQYLLSL